MKSYVATLPKFGLILLIAALGAVGAIAATSTNAPREAEAQTPLELQALCVNYYTSLVSAPSPITSTNCPSGTFALDIPDDFPFTLAINPYTGQVLYNPNPSPPYIPIVFPDAGVVPFCVSFYTGQLRYSASGACGAGSFTVAVTGQIGPDAVDDGPYTVAVGGTLTITTADPNDLLDNDDLGLPEAEIFRWGETDPLDNPVGVGVLGPAGGQMTVNADGSFTLANPSVTGTHTFQYTLANAAGSDVAAFTIIVQEAPTATDDGLYTVLEGETLTVTTADANDLLDNDLLGFPEAEIVSFGGGSLPGDATTNAAGDSVGLAGGTLVVNADGSFSLTTPDTGGQYTFVYRLENDADSDEATVTIEVQRPPDAVDDGPYTMTVNTTLTVMSSDPDDLLDNDDRGAPITGIDSFGVAVATTHAAGASVVDGLAGGDLQVNANGSFSLTNPDQTGTFTFMYRLENAAGFDDATVTIEIQGPPAAVDDSVAGDSSPGDLFHTALNTTLDSTLTGGDDNLLSNDDRGFPLGEIVSFGGGTLGGTIASNAAGETAGIVDQPDGSLTVNADGSFVFVPPTGFTGEFSFDYLLENSAGSDDATVTLAVGVRPSTLDDDYTTTTGATVLGNVLIDTSTSTGFSVLTNDTGDELDFTATTLTSVEGGNVMLNPDGSFEYDPPPGYEGGDSFTYEVDNGFGDPQTATVSLTVAGMLWFVDVNDPTAGGDGRLSDPFNCLVGTGCFDPVADDEAGDNVFLASGAYTGGLTLLASQLFVGEGSSMSIPSMTGVTVPADSPALPSTGGVNPQITTSNADALTLGADNGIVGITIGNTGTGTGIVGTNFGSAVITETDVTGTGQALDLSTGTLLAEFTTISSMFADGPGINLDSITGTTPAGVSGTTTISNPSGDGIAITNSSNPFLFSGLTTIDDAGANGINLSGGNGSVTFNSVDIDGGNAVGLRVQGNTNPVNVNGGSIGATNDPAGNAVDIDGGSADVTVAASVTKTTGGEVVEVTGRSGGTVALSNTITCNSGCQGLNVSSNTSGTTSFTGSVTANTGAQTAVNLTSNTGHTVTFSGGLDIDTTSGVGFNATGGGTVEVLDDAVTNDVDSTTGTAVNIQSTTIGSQGVTFESVSANGATNGIILSSTGASGGFSVTGLGSTDGSGGVIQNITDRGVEAISTQNLSLSNMNFINAGTTNGADPTDDASACGDVVTGTTTGCNSAVHLQSSTNTMLGNLSITGGAQVGISGADITGLSITDTVVQEVGNQLRESALKVAGLSGMVTITNSDFDGGGTAAGGPERAAWIGNSGSEVLSLTITGSTFRDTQDAESPPGDDIGADGLEIVHFGTASSTIDIVNSSFLRNRTNGLQVFSEDDSSVSVDVTGSTFDRGTGIGIGMDLAASDNGSLNFNVDNNPLINSNGGPAVNIAGGTSAFVQGRVTNNPNIQAGGAGTGGFGISVQINDSARGIVEISNNTISNIGTDAGIRAISRLLTGSTCGTICTAGRLDVTITSNDVTVTAGSVYDIWTQANDGNTICANVANNSTSGAGIAAFRIRTNAAESTALLQGFTVDATTTWNNNGNTPTDSVSSSHNGTLAGGTCTLPANPAP